MRIIWFCDDNKKINLSIGYDCVLNSEIKETNSMIKGSTQALYLRTRFQQSRFEFIFTSLVKNSPRLFSSFQAVIRSYETTKLYRDLKLRGAIVQDGELILLPKEQVFNKYTGVWNLSSEQGNLGSFYITNVRIVWFANLAEGFNVSLPWTQVKNIKVKESKFGTALVLETSEFSGNYILGFKLDNLDDVYTEITALYKVYTQNPVFGVECALEEVTHDIEKVTIPNVEDQLEIVDQSEMGPNMASAQYYMTAGIDSTGGMKKKEIIFSEEIGLAVEKPPEGLTLEELWKIL
jgi:Bardet-Biedl syndrome 5 protein